MNLKFKGAAHHIQCGHHKGLVCNKVPQKTVPACTASQASTNTSHFDCMSWVEGRSRLGVLTINLACSAVPSADQAAHAGSEARAGVN